MNGLWLTYTIFIRCTPLFLSQAHNSISDRAADMRKLKGCTNVGGMAAKKPMAR
jgi:hypothetical protein